MISQRKKIHPKTIAVAASLAALQIGNLYAQSAPAASDGTLNLDEVVITGTATRNSKMKQSVSVSTMSIETIEATGAQNAADILKSVPGIRAESTGGEANANINVRGLPSPDGGARYVQFQEDGLPIMLFGDIMFGTADGYMRADSTVDRLEVLRGGSASALTSNAPGGIINFISKTGEEKGGSIAITKGLNFDRTRYDINYGGPISEYTRFFIGGYYRNGEGVRNAGANAEDGGQIKANITHDLGKGDYVRLNFKSLNDQVPTYLPSPSLVGGSYPNYNILTGFNMPKGLIDVATNAYGQKVVTDTSTGVTTHSQSFGGELSLGLENGWRLNENFRRSANNGSFVGMTSPNIVGTVSSLLNTPGLGANVLVNGSMTNANTTLAGSYGAVNAVYHGTTTSAMNAQAFVGNLFNVTVKDLGNTVNDVKVSKSFTNADGSKVDTKVGLFNMQQNIAMDWQWSSYMLSLNGSSPQVIDILNSSGNSINPNGTGFANGAASWGNCCVQSYALKYNQTAPYAAAAWQKDNWNVDGSVRVDSMHATGNFAGSAVDYALNRPAYSTGANYLINSDLSVFGRYSHGTRFNADRVAGSSALNPTTGSIISADALFDTVDQYEFGTKMRQGNLSLFSTLFKAKTRINSYDPTKTPPTLSASYDAQGVELEAGYKMGAFRLAGGLTYTDAKIVQTSLVPQRQAKWVYNLMPTYKMGDWLLGGNVVGTTSSPIDNTNTVYMPGYTLVNAFAAYSIDKNTTASVTVANLTNATAITEVQATNGTYWSPRVAPGRAIQGTLKYNF